MTARAEPAAGIGRHRVGTVRLSMALKLAWRDLRGGLGGYWIVLVCIALGTMAIAGVGSVEGSRSAGRGREGRAVLGGDVAVSTVSEPLPAPEHDWLATRGRLSKVVTTRTTMRFGDQSGLVDLKAVDDRYPTVGTVELDPAQPLAAALAAREGLYGFAADPALTERLGLKVGDTAEIGAARLVLAAVLKREPDRLAGGIAFAPRVLMSVEARDATGLVRPGSLARFTTRVDLGGPQATADLARFVEDAKAAFPTAGWDVKTRDNVSPEFARTLGRFTQFLVLIGLTSLVVGGVGVGNAVKAATERKRASLAVLKALGAPGRLVFLLGLAQVMMVAGLGAAVGLALGAALPFALAWGAGRANTRAVRRP